MMTDDLHVKIGCDSSELDAAMMKLEKLNALAREANRLGALPAALAVTSVITQAEQKRLSRRGLIFFWRDR